MDDGRVALIVNPTSGGGRGWRVLGESNSAALTAWGANPPDNPSTTLLGAGSSTLQEWTGCIAHAAVWNAALSEGEMRRVMTLGE